jgi:membrane glycosyltransferase
MTTALRLPLLPEAEVFSLPMPDQDFAAAFRDPTAGHVQTGSRILALRALTLLAPLLLTSFVAWVSFGWFAFDGRVTIAETLLILVTGFAFYWVVLSLVTAILGLFWRSGAAPKPTPDQSLGVAILLPMFGEAALPTLSHAVHLLAKLAQSRCDHRFRLHVLSDTRDTAQAEQELAVFHHFQRSNPGLDVTYRRRPMNRDFKSGNIRDWVRVSGAAHDAMLVLDADSVMTAESVLLMADALACDATCGLVQSVPRVLPGTTVWQAMQSFASRVYGANLARGLALWTANEASFLGHNALIRIGAFAASAGLPHLSGRAPRGGVILSHDFVEAALMRRAGWGVKLFPEATGSFEDTPETLLGYLKRDRRWCQGNMQHLGLLAVPGLHAASRFHLLQGAMAYIASVWWLALLVLWALPTQMATGTGIWAVNPLIPVWPNLPAATQSALAGLVMVILVGPKLIGIAAFLHSQGLAKGERLAFVGMVLGEMVLSLLMAPTLMVHQVRAVVGFWAGFDGGWAPHSSGRQPLGLLARLHATETTLGAGLLTYVAAGQLSPWLLPVAVSLILALPLALLAQSPMAPFNRSSLAKELI